MYRQLFSLVFILIFCKCYNCETCLFQNACKCKFTNGSVIDLTSLGYHDKPRFGNMKARKPDNFTYYYNPCFDFKLGKTGNCSEGVAVCQEDSRTETYNNCGDSDSVNFLLQKNQLKLVYSAAPRSTYVTLVCSEDAIEPRLVVNGENLLETYEMTLTSRCACPDLCPDHHLSTGSVLVILFMIFVVLYLVLGIVHSSLTRGAHGWELIPNYEFWVDFPLLVRDGCVFVVSGCKAETAYERI